MDMAKQLKASIGLFRITVLREPFQYSRSQVVRLPRQPITRKHQS